MCFALALMALRLQRLQRSLALQNLGTYAVCSTPPTAVQHVMVEITL
jgi:hypothetical protein